MSNRKALIGLITGMASGYVGAGQLRDKREREEKEDAWKEEQREAWREEREGKKTQALKMSDAVADRAVIEGEAVPDSRGNKNFYTDPAQAKAASEEAAIEADMRGEVMTARPTKAFGVTGTAKGNQILADAPDVAAMNTPEAKMGRLSDVLMATDPAQAMALKSSMLSQEKTKLDMDEAKRARAKALEQEGIMNVARVAPSGDPALVAGAFNAQGEWKVDGELSVVKERKKAPWGEEIDTFTYSGTLVGPDGVKKPVRANSLELMTQMIPFKDQFEAQGKAYERQVDQGNKDRDHELRRMTAENEVDYRNRVLGINAMQEQRAQETHAITMQSAKIPPAVKMQADSLAKQLEGVNSALNKAMSEGLFDPNNEGTKRLLERQAALGVQYRQVIAPYTGGGAGGPAPAASDPLGFRSPAPAAQGAQPAAQPASAPAAAPAPMPAPGQAVAPRVTPQVQAARDTDRLAILQSEMAAAQHRLASGDPRAQGDVQALQSELQRMGVQPAAPAARAVPVAAPAAAMQQPAPVVNMGTAPVAQPAAAPARPAVNMQAAVPAPAAPQVSPVAQALAGPSASPSLVAAAQERAVVVEALAGEVKAAQAAVVQAAQAGDEKSIKASMEQAKVASAKLKEMLKGMNPQQAAIVIRAAGLQ